MSPETIAAALLADAPGRGWGGGTGAMLLWGTLNLLFWVAIIVGAVWLVLRFLRSAERRPRPVAGEHILAERYARGEIDTDEFQQRLAVLRGQTTPGD